MFVIFVLNLKSKILIKFMKKQTDNITHRPVFFLDFNYLSSLTISVLEASSIFTFVFLPTFNFVALS